MRFLLFIVLLVVPLYVKADQPRHNYLFTSSNGKYELKHTSGQFSEQKWSLIEKATESVRYQVTADLAAMTVLISNDGNNLVAVDDYNEREPAKNLDVLFFYREGKLAKKFALGELLNDTSNIQSSVSHFRWFFRVPSSIDDGKLNLTTYEITNYTFDVESGTVLKKQRDATLSDNSLYIYGKIRKLSKERYEIEVCHRVQGTVPESGKIEFEAKGKDLFFADSYYSIIVENGKFIAKKGVILNSCNYEK